MAYTIKTRQEFKQEIKQYFKENPSEWSDYISGARESFSDLFEFELEDAVVLIKYHFFDEIKEEI